MADSSNNIDQINVIIANLKDKFIPNKTLMTAIAEEMIASVKNNFNSSNPQHWKALQTSTIKQKRKKGFVESILQAQGNLMNSIQSDSTDNAAIVGTNLRYAAIHHFGGVISISARTRTLFHRTDKKGNLLKRSLSGDEDDNFMLVFAKKSHKNKAAYTFGQKSYNIKIPARPFMVLTESYKNNIIGIIHSHIAAV